MNPKVKTTPMQNRIVLILEIFRGKAVLMDGSEVYVQSNTLIFTAGLSNSKYFIQLVQNYPQYEDQYKQQMAKQREAEENLRKLSQYTHYLSNWDNKEKRAEHYQRISSVKFQSKSEEKCKMPKKCMYMDGEIESQNCQIPIKWKKNSIAQIAFPIISSRNCFNDRFKGEQQPHSPSRKIQLKTENNIHKDIYRIIEGEIQRNQRNTMEQTKINFKKQYKSNHIEQMKQTFVRNIKIKISKKHKTSGQKQSKVKWEEEKVPIKQIKRIIDLNQRRRSMINFQKYSLSKEN